MLTLLVQNVHRVAQFRFNAQLGATEETEEKWHMISENTDFSTLSSSTSEYYITRRVP